MIRFILAVIAGISSGGLVIFLGTMVMDMIWPVANPEAEVNTPYYIFWIRIITHGIGTMVAGFIAGMVSIQSKYSSGIIAWLVVISAVTYFVFINKLPSWVTVADISISAIIGFIGVLLGASKKF